MGGGRAGLPRPAWLGILLLLGLAAPIVALPRRAGADDIDASARDLRRARAYKVRLSAALVLAQRSDPRAVMALVRAVGQDPERTVRRVAALALARLADLTTDEARRAAIAALERARQRDRDRSVRRSAQRALDRMHAAEVDTASSASPRSARTRGRPARAGADRLFIHVGAPADLPRALPSGSGDALRAAVRGSLRRHAPDYALTSAELPTRAWLASRRLRGFAVTASVARVAVRPNGDQADVSCTVSVRVSPWSGSDGNERLSADESASATGNGRVTASGPDTRRAAMDCAFAVTEELAARQVIPFLRRVAVTTR